MEQKVLKEIQKAIAEEVGEDEELKKMVVELETKIVRRVSQKRFVPHEKKEERKKKKRKKKKKKGERKEEKKKEKKKKKRRKKRTII